MHYVVIAIGSVAEADTHLEVASRLRLVPDDELLPVMELAARLRQVLHGLRRSLAQRSS